VAFPEATRTCDGRIIPLQSGIIALAKRARCPIVPTVIEGAHEIWPRGRAWPGWAPVWVEYGQPIGAEDLSRMDQDQVAHYLTGRLRTMHNALRERIGRQPFDYQDSSHTAAGVSSLSEAQQG
jgi:1-acyl-sn-glycerol-3-phosphate acyltransferase